MTDVLAKICDEKREIVASRKTKRPLADVRAAIDAAGSTRGFYAALRAAREHDRYGLIAEIKKASPSVGLIREDFNPPALAKAYMAGGASCLSVLTDENYFGGADSYLIAAREAVDLPVLRKDFMVDPYQIYESRALGADCILLIMAALEDELAREMEAIANELDMDVLIEVHNRAELDRALLLESPLIGINNRNLKTLKVDLQTTLELSRHVGSERLVVGESGFHDPEDLSRCAAAGVTTFLIGESLMRQPDVRAATARLLAGDRVS